MVFRDLLSLFQGAFKLPFTACHFAPLGKIRYSSYQTSKKLCVNKSKKRLRGIEIWVLQSNWQVTQIVARCWHGVNASVPLRSKHNLHSSSSVSTSVRSCRSSLSSWRCQLKTPAIFLPSNNREKGIQILQNTVIQKTITDQFGH